MGAVGGFWVARLLSGPDHTRIGAGFLRLVGICSDLVSEEL